MPNLVGRDEELGRIERALAQTRSTQVATGMRISGATGAGKSALFAEAVHQAKAAGWLCVAVQCHKIQSTLSYVTARRLAATLTQVLGPDRERYAGGLDEALASPESVSEGFFRLVEGVLIDFPVLFAIDDANWIDQETRQLLDHVVQSFSDRRIAVLSMERSDETGSGLLTAQENIVLGRLPATLGAAIVREHYPACNEEVLGAILMHADGHPIDLVSLAQSARDTTAQKARDVDASVRAVITRELHVARPEYREFLQLCALIPEPIPYRILARLWPDDKELSRLIEAASGKYLAQADGGLSFSHAVIAQSIRETMAIEIPYRRRILDTLAEVKNPSLEDRERIVQQALACGDDVMARAELLNLANQAIKEAAHFTAAGAFERAQEIAAPAPSDFVRFYLDYSAVLVMQDRMAQTKSLMQRALDDAGKVGIIETGGLAARLLIAVWSTRGYSEALRAFASIEANFADPIDRMQLLSVVVWFYACADDMESFERTKTELVAFAQDLPAEIAMRLKIAEAFLRIRRGDAAAATSLVEQARNHAGKIVSAHRRSAEVSYATINLLRFGLRDADGEHAFDQIRRGSDAVSSPMVEYARAVCLFAEGRLSDAFTTVHEALALRTDGKSRRNLLGVSSAIETLRMEPSPHGTLIHQELAHSRDGDSDDSALAIGTWQAASIAQSDPARARALLARILAVLHRPPDPEAFVFPFALSLAAARLGDTELLGQLSEYSGIWHDRSPWQSAQRFLAMGYAREAIKRGSGLSLLTEAHQLFTQLRLQLFGAIAAMTLNRENSQAVNFLHGIGIKGLTNSVRNAGPRSDARKKGPSAPSRRELEIIALVAQGSTNREIAQGLFLSERTVEAHLANIFSKLNVSKRTQVAAWHVTSTFESSRTPPPRG